MWATTFPTYQVLRMPVGFYRIFIMLLRFAGLLINKITSPLFYTVLSV